jgi:50S ribosome-binding GTPase
VSLAVRGGRSRVDSVIERVEALRRFLAAAQDHVPEPELAPARTVVDRAGQRLALSRDHTVVALAGTTGSGKSSLFNALSRRRLSKVGVRRPTTGIAHACVWGLESASTLLDWLGVPPNRRFLRDDPGAADDDPALRGLVLLDLPDLDSVERSHRLEVDRLLALVDLVVWVLDPQKYADRVVHEQYLAQFRGHRDITVVVLNQADLLTPVDAERCLADLRRLVDDDGLDGVPVLATSTVGAPGLARLQDLLERAVAARQAALRRLAGDVDAVVDDLAALVDRAPPADAVDRGAQRALADALAQAAGVPAVVAATRRAYVHRAGAAMGWPVLRWLRRLRPDPLRRLHLPSAGTRDNLPVPVSSLPGATPAQRASVGLAVRTVGERAGGGLPGPWPAATVSAARRRLDDLPDALDVAIARTDLGLGRTPFWWRIVGAVQWLCTLAAFAGLVWLAVRYALFALGLPELPGPRVGRLPLATLLLLGGLLAGLLLGALVRPLIGIGAGRARRRAQARLRASIGEVAGELVVEPVRTVLLAYGEARAALRSAR